MKSVRGKIGETVYTSYSLPLSSLLFLSSLNFVPNSDESPFSFKRRRSFETRETGLRGFRPLRWSLISNKDEVSTGVRLKDSRQEYLTSDISVGSCEEEVWEVRERSPIFVWKQTRFISGIPWGVFWFEVRDEKFTAPYVHPTPECSFPVLRVLSRLPDSKDLT